MPAPDVKDTEARERAPGVTRKTLEKVEEDQSGRTLWMTEITYAPGFSAPVHQHPVAGLLYIIEGVAESAYVDEDPRLYRAGETLQDRANVPHVLFRNADPAKPLRFLATYLLEAGRDYVLEGSDDPMNRVP